MATVLSTEKAMTYARKAEKAKDWATAYDLYKGVLDRFPSNKRAKTALNDMRSPAVLDLLKSAQKYQSEKDWAKSVELMSIAYDLAPQLSEIGIALAAVQFELNHIPGALATANRILEHEPDHEKGLQIKIRALREIGRGNETEELLHSSLNGSADDADIYSQLAHVARSKGDRQSERNYSLKAIEKNPQKTAFHWDFARAHKFTEKDTHLSQMEDLLTQIEKGSGEEATLRMALFKAYDDLDEHDVAFGHLREANLLYTKLIDYDFKSDAVRYAVSKTIFPQSLQAPAAAHGPRPIFVTGLPRSGTTLTERIIAQGQGTQAGGELPVVNRYVGELLKSFMKKERGPITSNDFLTLRNNILEGLAEYRNGAPILIDKMPLNFRWIGYICAAIPEARIIHLNRDPMAVAWSHYRHVFSGNGNGFIYSFAGIAEFMVLHRNWMEHWRATFGEYIFDLNYADLVNDPVTTTKALAEFTGLEWHEGWLSPEKGKNLVRTASAQQVQKPIYSGSNEAWRKYENHLKPLQDMLTELKFI